MLGLLPYPLRHLLAIIFMEGSPQSTNDHAESGQSKRPRFDGGAGMTEEELAALPWGPRAGSLHVGDQPVYDPEEPTDYNDLRVERVHAAYQPPGAATAAAAAAANGLPLSKKRITPLDKKTEGGSVPKLALSSDTDGSAIRLSSTLNEAGKRISVSLQSDTIPSDKDMVARLSANLEEANWSAFSRIYTRGSTTQRTPAEILLQDTQRRVHAHVSDRRRFERQAKRPSRLFFISAFNPNFNVAVVHEETCPGLARSIFREKDMLLLGVLSA